MKAPAGTVRSWIHRARVALASQLGSDTPLTAGDDNDGREPGRDRQTLQRGGPSCSRTGLCARDHGSDRAGQETAQVPRDAESSPCLDLSSSPWSSSSWFHCRNCTCSALAGRPRPLRLASARPVARFRPTFGPRSFTAVSHDEWWMLGTARCGTRSRTCGAIIRTTDGGHKFAGIPSPSVNTSNVTQLRFANALDGYVFDPEIVGNDQWRNKLDEGFAAGAGRRARDGWW